VWSIWVAKRAEQEPADGERIAGALSRNTSMKAFGHVVGGETEDECEFISYKRKRTMRLIDEFNAVTQRLDRILEKMEEADPADKERLEAYVKSMQVKVQLILKAILRVH
jgi:hypothetical protein